jgi:hypothetical protein
VRKQTRLVGVPHMPPQSHREHAAELHEGRAEDGRAEGAAPVAVELPITALKNS